MKLNSTIKDYLWISSEICYYLGLVLTVLFLPLLALSLWIMSLVNVVETNFYYILIAWTLSLLMFFTGLMIKRKIQ